jgi:hypothetical protein
MVREFTRRSLGLLGARPFYMEGGSAAASTPNSCKLSCLVSVVRVLDTRHQLVSTHHRQQTQRERKHRIGVDVFLLVKSAPSYRNPKERKS